MILLEYTEHYPLNQAVEDKYLPVLKGLAEFIGCKIRYRADKGVKIVARDGFVLGREDNVLNGLRLIQRLVDPTNKPELEMVKSAVDACVAEVIKVNSNGKTTPDEGKRTSVRSSIVD